MEEGERTAPTNLVLVFYPFVSPCYSILACRNDRSRKNLDTKFLRCEDPEMVNFEDEYIRIPSQDDPGSLKRIWQPL